MTLQDRIKSKYRPALETARLAEELGQYEFVSDITVGMAIRIAAVLNIRLDGGLYKTLNNLFNEATN